MGGEGINKRGGGLFEAAYLAALAALMLPKDKTSVSAVLAEWQTKGFQKAGEHLAICS